MFHGRKCNKNFTYYSKSIKECSLLLFLKTRYTCNEVPLVCHDFIFTIYDSLKTFFLKKKCRFFVCFLFFCCCFFLSVLISQFRHVYHPEISDQLDRCCCNNHCNVALLSCCKRRRSEFSKFDAFW